MEHSEFVQSWNQGKLEIDVDRSKALQIDGSKILPRRYQAATHVLELGLDSFNTCGILSNVLLYMVGRSVIARFSNPRTF